MTSQALARARLAHAMPGRMRLRFDKTADVALAAQRLRAALSESPGVLAIEPRAAARSVVIQYNPAELEARRLLEESLPAAAIELMGPGAQASDHSASGTLVGERLIRAISFANAGLAKATRDYLDLRDLFPLTLWAFGLRRVARSGFRPPMPWYNLLFYGFSAFTALHQRRRAAQLQPDAREILRRRFARGELTPEQYREVRESL